MNSMTHSTVLITDTVERVLGRPATTFEQFAPRAAATGAWAPACAVR